MRSFTNQTYDEIEVGASLTLSHVLTEADVEALAMVSGEIERKVRMASNRRTDLYSETGRILSISALVSTRPRRTSAS